MKRILPSHHSIFCLTAISILLLIAAPVTAYNPPVDTAGPLTVRIEGPEEVTETGVPLSVRVVLENKGEEPIEGTLRLGLIDRWQAEPAAAVPFSVGANATTSRDFTVTAGEGTYSAHYPIHAFAQFTSGGKPFRAHPVLILEANLSLPVRAPFPLAWKPKEIAPGSQLALWRMRVRRSVVAVFDEEPLTMPVGWQGSEPRSHGGLGLRQERLDGDARSVIAIHPPWFDGLVGTLLVEYPLTLPQDTPLTLRFANAMAPGGQSDGVTFRVRVLPIDAADGQFGPVVFERHTDSKTWLDGKADLSRFAGRSIRLQLESHPGPKNNTGWDQSYWAEPILTAGTPLEPPPFPPQDDTGSKRLGTVGSSTDRYEVRVWPGRRGLLDAVVGFSRGNASLAFRGFEISVLGGRIDDSLSPILLKETVKEACDDGLQIRHRFESHEGPFDLVGRLATGDGVLRASFHLENAPPDRPWRSVRLEDVAAGPWSQRVTHLYAGAGNVIRDPGSFRLGFDGHRMSTSAVGFDFAESFSLVEAIDSPPTHLEVRAPQRHYSLHTAHASTLTFIPAENVWEAAKTWRQVNGLKAAGGVQKVAGRFVFDLWGGRYGESTRALEKAFRYGMTDAMVVWHNWQRWGYDYRLPEIYPPNPKLGTLDEMRQLIKTCKEAGVPIALHDNYIDYYPDADGFSYEKKIAFHQDGTPVKAWINEGRDARSYRYRADGIEPCLKQNLQLIRDRLAPDAYFIDVWSSARPYDYWTADGQFHSAVSTRDTWGELFAWIRDFLGNNAPQISESGHDQLIGWLDGAQANHLRVGPPLEGRYGWCTWNWKCTDAERTPWFDAVHHDRFILHGAGYSSRYQGGLDGRLHGMYSDDYIVTEVLTGHPGMVSRPFDRNVVRKYWLLSDLMRALALRTIESVEYTDGDLHRQHVRWSGGGHVWVNRGETDWTVAGRTLPEFGFFARVPTEAGLVEASIARRDGRIVEAASSPERLYVNGRQMTNPPMPIRLSVEELKHQGDRAIEMTLRWQVDVPIPAGWFPFLHFCKGGGEIAFQANHQPGALADNAEGTISSRATATIPDELRAGSEYELCYGFFNASTGARLTLAGPDIGDRRIRLGKIRLDGNGQTLTGVTWQPHEPATDPYLARRNPGGKPIDFGPLVTPGGCRLHAEGKTLVVTPLPGDRAPEFSVRLHWPSLRWNLPRPTHVESIGEDGGVLDRTAVVVDGGVIEIDCKPGVFQYRLVKD